MNQTIFVQVRDEVLERLRHDIGVTSSSAALEAPNAEQGLDLLQGHSRQVDAFVLGPSVDRPIMKSHAFWRQDRCVSILILTEPDRHPCLAESIVIAPNLRDIAICSPQNDVKNLSAQLTEAIERTRQRRSTSPSVVATISESASAALDTPQQDIQPNRCIMPKDLWTGLQNHPLANCFPECMVCVDLDGRIVFANEMYCRIHHKPADALIGTSCYDLVPKHLAEKYRQDNQHVVDTGEIIDRVDETFLSTGGRTFVRVVKTPIYNPVGSISGVFVASWNITSEKEVAEALRDSEQRFRRVFEDGPIGMTLVDREHRFIKVNRAFCEMIGYSEEELYTKQTDDVSVMSVPKSGLTETERLFRGELEVYHQEKQYVTKSGRPIWVRLTGTLLRDSVDQPRYRMNMIEDITARKEAEDKLRESEENYRTLVEESLQGILVVIKDKPLFVNEAYAAMHGYTVDEVMEIGSIKSLIAPHEYERLMGYNDDRLQGIPAPSRYEYEGVRKDGSPVWFENAVRVVQWDDQPAAQAMLVDCTDRKLAESRRKRIQEELELRVVERTKELTAANADLEKEIAEHRRTEENLKSATSELERSNRELRRFAYIASHDLQEPLRAVSGYCQLLKDRYEKKLDDDAKTYLDFAVDGATRMHSLINALLELSSVGARVTEIKLIDTKQVVDNVLTNLKASIQEGDVEITVDDLPDVCADEIQLMQLIQNLIGNAIKFRSSRPVKIHVRGREESDHWSLSVEDNGIGIEPEFVEQIFEVFHRLHHQSEYSGVGVGLSICKKIVDYHRGRIYVESTPGKGSVFHVTLPKQRMDKNVAISGGRD